jgi:flagellar protein FliS
MTSTAYAAYSQASINTGQSKERMLLMLYEGAVKFARLARVGIEEKNIALKGENICKVVSILSELDCALDRKAGGELAENLDALYQYMILRLTHANLKNDAKAVEEVENLLTELKDGFEGAVELNKAAIPVQHNAVSPVMEGKVDCAV